MLYAGCNVQVWVCTDASEGWDWPVFAHSYICMCIYVCVNMSVGVPCIPAGSTWLCCHHSGSCCECPCRLAERGDPLCGSPRRRGASCTSFVTPFGPLCLWLPCSGPTWQLPVQTDICSFQPPGEQRKQQLTDPALLHSALHTLLHRVTQCLLGQ